MNVIVDDSRFQKGKPYKVISTQERNIKGRDQFYYDVSLGDGQERILVEAEKCREVSE